MSTQTQTAVITASRKLASIITRMRETDYDANTLHGQFIAAHEELNLALKRHDAETARLTTRKGRTKIGSIPLLRGTDLLTSGVAA
jgi:hypothetical protein